MFQCVGQVNFLIKHVTSIVRLSELFLCSCAVFTQDILRWIMFTNTQQYNITT